VRDDGGLDWVISRSMARVSCIGLGGISVRPSNRAKRIARCKARADE